MAKEEDLPIGVVAASVRVVANIEIWVPLITAGHLQLAKEGQVRLNVHASAA